MLFGQVLFLERVFIQSLEAKIGPYTRDHMLDELVCERIEIPLMCVSQLIGLKKIGNLSAKTTKRVLQALRSIVGRHEMCLKINGRPWLEWCRPSD
jgi:hypothetical protein